MAFTIELGRENVNRCGCCGERAHTIRGFVNNDGHAHAVYFAGFTEGHGERGATLVVSLGNWAADATPDDRLAVVIKVRRIKGKLEMMLGNARDSLWTDIQVLGRIMDRNEALAHEWKDEFFHVADHAVLEDPRLAPYLAGKKLS